MKISVVILQVALLSISGQLLAAEALNIEELNTEADYSAKVEASMMQSFNASAEKKDPPKQAKRVSDLDLTGEWRTPRGYHSTSITFAALASGADSVRFETGGCMGAWHFDRKGTYANGTITLDAPVKEYLPGTYTVIHAVQHQGKTFLVPSARVGDFDKALRADDDRFDALVMTRVQDEKSE